ncbi:hypothetical protein ACVXHB_29215 [Escherichia coli]
MEENDGAVDGTGYRQRRPVLSPTRPAAQSHRRQQSRRDMLMRFHRWARNLGTEQVQVCACFRIAGA